jgi:hypothetical protein
MEHKCFESGDPTPGRATPEFLVSLCLLFAKSVHHMFTASSEIVIFLFGLFSFNAGG